MWCLRALLGEFILKLVIQTLLGLPRTLMRVYPVWSSLMAKKGGGGGGSPSWGGIAKAGIGKLFDMFGGYPPMPVGRVMSGAWIPLGEPTTPTANAQRNGIFWGGQTLLNTPNTSVLTSILIESPRASLGQAAAPVFPRLTLNVLDGQIDLGTIGFTGVVPTVVLGVVLNVGVGLYVARYDNATNLYETQDPLNSSDASRFDWIYLESRLIQMTIQIGALNAYPVYAPATPKLFDLTKADFNQDIGPGEAIMLAVNCSANSIPSGLTPQGLSFTPNLRGYLTRGT